MKMNRCKLFASLLAAAAAVAAGLGITAAAVDSTDGWPNEGCCCIEQDGRLICTITGEVLDECCCRR